MNGLMNEPVEERSQVRNFRSLNTTSNFSLGKRHKCPHSKVGESFEKCHMSHNTSACSTLTLQQEMWLVRTPATALGSPATDLKAAQVRHRSAAPLTKRARLSESCGWWVYPCINQGKHSYIENL